MDIYTLANPSTSADTLLGACTYWRKLPDDDHKMLLGSVLARNPNLPRKALEIMATDAPWSFLKNPAVKMELMNDPSFHRFVESARTKAYATASKEWMSEEEREHRITVMAVLDDVKDMIGVRMSLVFDLRNKVTEDDVFWLTDVRRERFLRIIRLWRRMIGAEPFEMKKEDLKDIRSIFQFQKSDGQFCIQWMYHFIQFIDSQSSIPKDVVNTIKEICSFASIHASPEHSIARRELSKRLTKIDHVDPVDQTKAIHEAIGTALFADDSVPIHRTVLLPIGSSRRTLAEKDSFSGGEWQEMIFYHLEDAFERGDLVRIGSILERPDAMLICLYFRAKIRLWNTLHPSRRPKSSLMLLAVNYCNRYLKEVRGDDGYSINIRQQEAWEALEDWLLRGDIIQQKAPEEICAYTDEMRLPDNSVVFPDHLTWVLPYSREWYDGALKDAFSSRVRNDTFYARVISWGMAILSKSISCGILLPHEEKVKLVDSISKSMKESGILYDVITKSLATDNQKDEDR